MTETTVVNRFADSFDVDIGREKVNDRYRHINNTPPPSDWEAGGKAGWLGNHAVMEDRANSLHREQDDIVIVPDRTAAVAHYEQAFKENLQDPDFREAVLELEGKTLGCYCKGQPVTEPGKGKLCHGDVILKFLKYKREDW